MDTALLQAVKGRLAAIGEAGPGAPDLPAQAVALAGELLALARSERRRSEAAAEHRLARLMEDEPGRLLTLAFTDQALRAKRPERVADQLRHLLERHGIPRYFSTWERAQLRAFKTLGGAFPRWLVPKVLARLRYEVRRVALPADAEALSRALAERKALGIEVNLNHLGEAILGEDEARARHAAYLGTLARPDIESVSVKVSSIASQINLLAWDDTLALLEARVGALYREALAHPIGEGAARRPKLVMLDMEEYRDLELTLSLFERLLARDEFRLARAGIVLQAYLPDSHPAQRRLVALAERRVAAGGTPIHVRLVKGANLAMERVDASLHGWAQAPYRTKAEVDANYKRLVAYGLSHAAVAHVGVATHNLFDLAWAMVERAAHRLEGRVVFEMLEGIAAPLARVVQAVSGALMIYAPTADDKDLLAAIAYLIRRLDENTGPDNFLRASFGMELGSDAFEAERDRFVAALAERDRASVGPRRVPAIGAGARRPAGDLPFFNAPDTDWALPDNRAWIARELERVRAGDDAGATIVEAQVAGEDVASEALAAGFDPSRPGVVTYRFAEIGIADAERAILSARGAASSWAARTASEREAILQASAEGLTAARGELIALMVSDAGKAIPEGDAEVSEAIDFARYYGRQCRALAALAADGLQVQPRGVVLVTPPWNFPLAIPAGGVLAALAAGNAVILKPAPETPRVARRLCEILWSCGVPREVLQFLPCANDPVGTFLVAHDGIGAIVLTGASETARRFLAHKDDRVLVAETGGKNAMIVTAMADWDLAIKHSLHSAFGHAGQKCSATSLLVLEAALYDDPAFLERLRDATQSLRVGGAWDPASKVTPLIREPRGHLAWALSHLDAGETWLVAPRMLEGNPRLWSPGVKLGVKVGSRTYDNELFGPVLAVMRAADLDDALAIANGVAYGLTAGIQSLDDREIARWKDAMQAGCLYVNRATTGAIVERQPFGGMKASVFGPGAKAGGPNYVMQLATIRDGHERAPDYPRAFATHFAAPVDPVRLVGQDNHLRYRPLAKMILRLGPGAARGDAERAIEAARTCGTPLSPSADVSLGDESWVLALGATIESTAALVARLAGVERVRALGVVDPALRAACNPRGIHVAAEPVVSAGRVELLRYLREQTISEDYHRFGNLGVREGEPRRPVD